MYPNVSGICCHLSTSSYTILAQVIVRSAYKVASVHCLQVVVLVQEQVMPFFLYVCLSTFVTTCTVTTKSQRWVTCYMLLTYLEPNSLIMKLSFNLSLPTYQCYPGGQLQSDELAKTFSIGSTSSPHTYRLELQLTLCTAPGCAN